MSDDRAYIDDITLQFRDVYTKRKVLMTFEDYVDLVAHNPRKFIRNSAQYLLDAFAYFGTETVTSLFHSEDLRFKLFNIGTDRSGPIIGGESFQNEFYYILKNFARNGFNSLLTLFHGPNGSAKSSSVETIANAMEIYSKTEEGAIYRFNWIFPTDKDSYPAFDNQAIGFRNPAEGFFGKYSSFALLEESKIAAKLGSEFKENPLFLIPMPFRERWVHEWMHATEAQETGDFVVPPHLFTNGLSKKNQEIFEHLLNSYQGDLAKVFRHVQVERFYYSKQYRVGISTVEPQMSIDAFEKQVTLDKNYSNLPSILQTINFHQYVGPIVEANRGLLEFSDLLKRPIETFKYLISAIEKSSINLPSGTAGLDIIFVATTNDKHLDAFKSIPDFSSFKGRFELVTVPYILIPEQEELIFLRDIKMIKKSKPVCPHSLSLLCAWGVLTRLKQPDPEKYPQKYRPLLSRLDPLAKLHIYQNKRGSLSGFSRQEQALLKEVRHKIVEESQGTLIYEGRFGASPRELRVILHKAAHNPKYIDLTPMAVFEEIESLIKDKSVYEFLQFEPRGHYHDVSYFLEKLKEQFTRTFENEVIQSMSMVGEREYDLLLERYVMNVVAYIKNEKIFDEASRSYVPPSEKIMSEIEGLLQLNVSVNEHRNTLLSRIAAFRIENPTKDVVVRTLFHDYLTAIKEHSYNEKRKIIELNFKAMIALERGEKIDEESEKMAMYTYKNMEEMFSYSRQATYDCMRFVFKQKASQKEL
jgi:predicted Ser/Thr protein kinase